MQMNFIDDLKRQLTRELRQLGCRVSDKESEEDLLRRWFDYEMRTIPPVPRKTVESPRFAKSRKNLSADEKAALKTIIEKLQRGDDVTGHLSKGILEAGNPDRLIADWRIYHIHISDTKKSPKDFFFKRADHLAFVIVNSASAYFLDIYPHNEKNIWSKADLLEIVHEAWPDLLRPYRFVGKLEPDVAISPADREKLRKAGITVPTVIGDSVILPPGGGVNAAGFSVSVRSKTNRTLNTLRIIQMHFEGYPEIADELANDLGFRADDLSIKLEWAKGGFRFREEKSGKYLMLDMDIVRKGAAALLRKKKLCVRAGRSPNSRVGVK